MSRYWKRSRYALIAGVAGGSLATLLYIYIRKWQQKRARECSPSPTAALVTSPGRSWHSQLEGKRVSLTVNRTLLRLEEGTKNLSLQWAHPNSSHRQLCSALAKLPAELYLLVTISDEETSDIAEEKEKEKEKEKAVASLLGTTFHCSQDNSAYHSEKVHLLFGSTDPGRSAMVRQLDVDIHIESDLAEAERLRRFVNVLLIDDVVADNSMWSGASVASLAELVL